MTATPATEERLSDDDRWAVDLEEYEWMRSFGMGHQRACQLIGRSVSSFTRQAQRRRYPIHQ